MIYMIDVNICLSPTVIRKYLWFDIHIDLYLPFIDLYLSFNIYMLKMIINLHSRIIVSVGGTADQGLLPS